MATRYSKDKYARIRDLKNEPLAKLTSDSKKRKFGDEKVDVAPSTTVNVAPPSPTPSLEVTAVTPPITRPKGKSKIGQSVWDDPATALGRAHNVITNDELKSLSSIPSHELVSRHIHKLEQVLGESLRITIDYLNTEEKVVVATSKVESVEVECSQLKKDLITAMNERNKANQRIKELTEALRMEKALVVQKDEQIQAALLKTDEERVKVIKNFKESEEFSDLQFIQYFKGFELLRRWTMKHHSTAINFSNLGFEKIDTEILEDESKEPEKDEFGIPEKDKATDGESSTPPS
nr:hypothetical protein CFP56_72574 [Quercus suber]POF10611.1 hypothetical protein CFP56_23383 [Quercus suber]